MRLFLDTNVFIVGVAVADSPEAKVLDLIGFFGEAKVDVQVIVSPELLDQVRRVARRVGGKDWSGEIINRLWQTLSVIVVPLEVNESDFALWEGKIPREDIGIFLTALRGSAVYFISANHALIRAAANESNLFACYTADEFLSHLEL